MYMIKAEFVNVQTCICLFYCSRVTVLGNNSYTTFINLTTEVINLSCSVKFVLLSFSHPMSFRGTNLVSDSFFCSISCVYWNSGRPLKLMLALLLLLLTYGVWPIDIWSENKSEYFCYMHVLLCEDVVGFQSEILQLSTRGQVHNKLRKFSENCTFLSTRAIQFKSRYPK